MKMIGKLLGSEGMHATAVMALSGTLVALVAKGNGPVSLKGIVSGTLSNPVPRPVPTSARAVNVSLEADHAKIAA